MLLNDVPAVVVWSNTKVRPYGKSFAWLGHLAQGLLGETPKLRIRETGTAEMARNYGLTFTRIYDKYRAKLKRK